MAATAREAIRELMAQAMATLDVLLEAADPELSKSSSHACAQGKDVWILITNDIDHERIHTGQVPEGRYESRRTASPMELLIADWRAERARFIGSPRGRARFAEDPGCRQGRRDHQRGSWLSGLCDAYPRGFRG
jgi:hypothetical protein